MANNNQSAENGAVHYEGGVPIIGDRLDKVEREQQATKKRDEQYKADQIKINRRLVLFTGVLAICSILGAVITGWQAHIASRTITEMQETRRQTILDNASAITAQQTIAQSALATSQGNFDKTSKDAQNTFRDEQRAWVGALGIYDVVFKEGEIPTLRVNVTNSGKTPALHLQFTTFGKSRPRNEKIEFTYPPVAKDQLISDFVLEPGAQYLLSAGGPPTPPLTKPQLDAIKSGEARFWLYGKMSYQDASKRRHHTKFCFILSPDLNGGNPCDTYNEAD